MIYRNSNRSANYATSNGFVVYFRNFSPHKATDRETNWVMIVNAPPHNYENWKCASFFCLIYRRVILLSNLKLNTLRNVCLRLSIHSFFEFISAESLINCWTPGTSNVTLRHSALCQERWLMWYRRCRKKTKKFASHNKLTIKCVN